MDSSPGWVEPKLQNTGRVNPRSGQFQARPIQIKLIFAIKKKKKKNSKHTALRSKSKDWLTVNQDNVLE
jgi:hypothetical protein